MHIVFHSPQINSILYSLSMDKSHLSLQVTYASAISACAKAKPVRAEKALELRASMRADGVQPDVVVYTALIDACAKAKGKLRAVAPSQAAATARALSSSGSSSGGGGGAGAAGGSGRSFATSGARTGPERALELLDEMRLDGLQPNGYTYGCAINACAAEGRWERALELLEAARSYSQLQASTSSGSGNSGSNSGDSLGGQGSTTSRNRDSGGGRCGGSRGGRDDGVGLPAYNAALRACERGRQPQRALDLIGRMELEAAQGTGPAPDVRSYTAAIAACAKAQPGTMATIALAPVLATAPLSTANTKVATASSKAAEATATAAAAAAAAAAAEPAFASSKGTAGSDGAAAAAAAAANPMEKSTVAWWEAALQLLRTAKRSGPASRPNCYAYASTCAACARDGQWKPALTLLDEMALLG